MDPRKYGVKDTIVTIEVHINDPIDEQEPQAIREDLYMFALSIGATILQSPLVSLKTAEKILAVFEINSHMTQAVEDYFYKECNYPAIYEATLTTNKLEPITPNYVKVIDS